MPPKKSKPPTDAPSTSSTQSDTMESITMAWDLVTMVTEMIMDEEPWAVANVVKLLQEGCSIPFITRYRKEMTNGMEADKIREVASVMQELK